MGVDLVSRRRKEEKAQNGGWTKRGMYILMIVSCRIRVLTCGTSLQEHGYVFSLGLHKPRFPRYPPRTESMEIFQLSTDLSLE